MKYLVGVGLLLFGGLLGYLIGAHSTEEDDAVDSTITEFITQTVHDTIIQKETVNIPVSTEEDDSLSVLTDSLLSLDDSLNALNSVDTLDNDLSIRREVLENSIWIKVEVLQDFEEKDSLIKKMMGIEDQMPSTILIEFWSSPLNFSGYKLSRSKLVIYGMPPHLEYSLYRKRSEYYLSTENIYYSLEETEEFKSYNEVTKEKVFND